jgi:hypothetical protein
MTPDDRDAIWEDVKSEVAAMEAWYARDGENVGANIFVGWDRYSQWYAGMSIDGEVGEEPYQQEADTPEAALRLLIAESRAYRERIDRERREEDET